MGCRITLNPSTMSRTLPGYRFARTRTDITFVMDVIDTITFLSSREIIGKPRYIYGCLDISCDVRQKSVTSMTSMTKPLWWLVPSVTLSGFVTNIVDGSKGLTIRRSYDRPNICS